MSVATTVIPAQRTATRTRRAPKVTQIMPLSMALELLSGEAMYFCRSCQASAFKCTHANVAESVYGVQCRVGDFIHLKRNNAKYESLRAALAEEGQRSPVGLCRHGRSIVDGHHRLAALAELMVPFISWEISQEECSCDLV